MKYLIVVLLVSGCSARVIKCECSCPEQPQNIFRRYDDHMPIEGPKTSPFESSGTMHIEPWQYPGIINGFNNSISTVMYYNR